MIHKHFILRNILLLFFAFGPLFSVVHAESNTQLLQKANKAYQQENYNEAIDLYEQVAQQKIGSADLYYNLGNAYFKAGFNAKALLWYERALRLNPSDEDVQHNIAFVNQKISDKIEPLPQTTVQRLWNNISMSFSERQWGILSIVFSFLLTLCVVAYIFARHAGLRIGAFIIFWISALLLVLSVVFGHKEKARAQQNDEAIVMNLVVEAKSEPTSGGRTIFVIHEGLKVQMGKEMNNYVEIRIPNGEKGWISKSAIEKI